VGCSNLLNELIKLVTMMALLQELPAGESIADWLIDISSGRLPPNLQQPKKSKARRQKDNDDAFMSDDEADAPDVSASTADQEKARRDILYNHWNMHFKSLGKKKRSLYDAPAPFPFPLEQKRPSFLRQLKYQIHRLIILSMRNWYTKLLDTVIVIGAVILISILDGVMEPTLDMDTNNLDYFNIAEPNPPEAMIKEFPKLFEYAITANLKIVQ